jgi:pimeloyl-ACP methyl ester carboxylesterase
MKDSAAPPWFEWALQQPRQSHFAEADGTRVHYASWNAADAHKPGLLFAHGFLGHSHWWDFIAPFFTERFRVYALDFSGMGDSGHRPAYRREVFIDDLAAVIEHAGIAPATVVGHSFGGSLLLHACRHIPALIGHAIVLDSYVSLRGEPPPTTDRRPAPRPYADEATALSRFRLLPPQPCPPWAFEHLARHSLRETADGWVWSFDPALRGLPPPVGDDDLLRRITVPVSYVHAELSAVVSAERARSIVAAIPNARGPVTMPQTHHHVMLDQPLMLVGMLRALLA